MISDFQVYHGVVFSKLCHYTNGALLIQQYPSRDNASYIVNDKIGLYIKYSTKRMTPWHFSFESQHKAEIREMSEQINRLVVVLVSCPANSFTQCWLYTCNSHSQHCRKVI